MSETCCGSDGCTPASSQAAHAPVAAHRESGPTMSVFVSAGLIGAGAVAHYLDWPIASIVFYLGATAISISTPARRAWRSLRARVLDINVLMVIAVVGAMALRDWAEAAAVVWLFGISHWLEHRSADRARHAIRALMSFAPAVARLRRDGRDQIVPAADVAVGDVIVVVPGERVPVDGRVVSGESAVDQAPVTGESWPVDKQPGDVIFAGSINGSGALEIATSRVASDSTIARIIHMVEAAHSRRAPVQTFVDRFARRYTPTVVLLAVLLAVVPPLLLGGADGWGAAFATWSYRALALLVVACPCALVISTPVSIVSALTAAAREGVLIKGGAHLEQLGLVRCVAFDKTGTLTDGRVTVNEVLAVDGGSSHGVLSVAASLEARSEHPIGRAIVTRARAAGLEVSPGESFRALPGLGAEATVAAEPAIVGNHRLFEERQLCTPSLHARIDEVEGRGGTAVLVGRAGSALGVIGLTDRVRKEGQHAVAMLHAQGIERVVLLTGDRAANAAIVRDGLGLDEAHAELLPADKVDHIARLRARYGVVAMVGDGVNDAPALAASDVGIAMGIAGSGVAIETADVALMSDDLGKLPYAFRLGRATLRNIRMNVGIALGLKVGFVLLAAFGVATLWMAILADTGASILVTANSLRLLKAK